MIRFAILLLSLLAVVSCQTISVVQSARDTGDRLAQKPSINFNNLPAPNAVTVTVERATRYQDILGFGGALTESAATVFCTTERKSSKSSYRSLFWANWTWIYRLPDTYKQL